MKQMKQIGGSPTTMYLSVATAKKSLTVSLSGNIIAVFVVIFSVMIVAKETSRKWKVRPER
jgi:hypothetical protein